MRLVLQILVLLLSVLPLLAQLPPNSGGTAKWRTFSSKNEFSIAMPDSAKGFTEENDFSMGRGPGATRITKRVLVSALVSRTALLIEFFEGDVAGARDQLVERLGQAYKVVKTQDFDGTEVRLLERRQEKLYSVQQFVLFKKSLYVIQAHAPDDNDRVLGLFLRSLTLSIDGKILMPNLPPGDDRARAQQPPEIVLTAPATADDEPIKGKPDRDAIILYRPRPRYSPEARMGRAAGTVVLNVVLSATGRVGKIEVESGEMALRNPSIAAVENILFIPAEKDGKPVSVWKKISYSFEIY
ncbi:MAG TPA: energy transducer TonB [Pyrinomonadaceae bacterium]|nr:energy transducer TonB [Pyrinomonadaceae bacterium]